MNKRHYEHTLPNIRGSLSNTYDYRAFLKKSGFKAREGKQVSISKETHDKVAMIVRWLGDGEVTMADFTENVVREFLRTHRDELNRMLNALPRIDL